MNRKILIALMVVAFASPIAYVVLRQTFTFGSRDFTIQDKQGDVIGNGKILIPLWISQNQKYDSFYSVSVPSDSPLTMNCFDGAKRKCTVEISDSRWYIELSPTPNITHDTLWIGGDNEGSLVLRYEFYDDEPPLGHIRF